MFGTSALMLFWFSSKSSGDNVPFFKLEQKKISSLIQISVLPLRFLSFLSSDSLSEKICSFFMSVHFLTSFASFSTSCALRFGAIVDQIVFLKKQNMRLIMRLIVEYEQSGFTKEDKNNTL